MPLGAVLEAHTVHYCCGQKQDWWFKGGRERQEGETRSKIIFVVERSSAPTNTKLISFPWRLEPDCPRGCSLERAKLLAVICASGAWRIKSYLQDRKWNALLGKSSWCRHSNEDISFSDNTWKQGWQAAKRSQRVHGEYACRKRSRTRVCSVNFVLTVPSLFFCIPSLFLRAPRTGENEAVTSETASCYLISLSIIEPRFFLHLNISCF